MNGIRVEGTVGGAEAVCGNCLANTRNLINANFLQGTEPEAQEEQAEGTGRDRRQASARSGKGAFQVHTAGAPYMLRVGGDQKGRPRGEGRV